MINILANNQIFFNVFLFEKNDQIYSQQTKSL